MGDAILLVPDRIDPPLGGEGAAVLAVADQVADEGPAPAPGVALLLQHLAVGLHAIQDARPPVDELLLRIAGHPGEGGVDPHEARISDLGGEDGDRQKSLFEGGVAQPQRLFRPLAARDVGDGADVADDAGSVVGLRACLAVDPGVVTVSPAIAVFRREGTARPDRRLPLFDHRLPVAAVETPPSTPLPGPLRRPTR